MMQGLWSMAFLLCVFLYRTSVLPAWADVYKCTDSQGKARFQDAPCDGETPPLLESQPNPSTSPFVAAPTLPLAPPATGNPTVDAAFKALRKLQAATEVGIAVREYGQLVVEARAAVNDIAPKGQKDRDLQTALEAAMRAYADALTAWQLSLQMHTPGTLVITHPEVRPLYQTYHFALGGFDWTTKEVALSMIWAVANNRLLRATALAQ